MKIIVVDGREVIQCPHCAGTGTCKKAVKSHEGSTKFFACNRCGRGVVAPNAWAYEIAPPTCAVCGGTGHNRV